MRHPDTTQVENGIVVLNVASDRPRVNMNFPIMSVNRLLRKWLPEYQKTTHSPSTFFRPCLGGAPSFADRKLAKVPVWLSNKGPLWNYPPPCVTPTTMPY
jgi:hypothetical protein